WASVALLLFMNFSFVREMRVLKRRERATLRETVWAFLKEARKNFRRRPSEMDTRRRVTI
ncbi:hypothetical protein R0K05_21500, partial [Planococcus sp. SIMBA_160]